MLIYLASPYSPVGEHSRPQKKLIRKKRFEEACQVAARIMVNAGHQVFSPIAHSHSVELHGFTPSDEKFWLDQDFAILGKCEELWIAMMDGWKKSSGIKKEWLFAVERGIPVKLLNINTGETSDAPNPVSGIYPSVTVRKA